MSIWQRMKWAKTSYILLTKTCLPCTLVSTNILLKKHALIFLVSHGPESFIFWDLIRDPSSEKYFSTARKPQCKCDDKWLWMVASMSRSQQGLMKLQWTRKSMPCLKQAAICSATTMQECRLTIAKFFIFQESELLDKNLLILKMLAHIFKKAMSRPNKNKSIPDSFFPSFLRGEINSGWRLQVTSKW